MEKIVLVGYGGHARSVADVIEREGKYHIVGYTENTVKKSEYTYLGKDDILQELFNKGVNKAAICLGYLGKNTVREDLYVKIKRIGYELPAIVDPSAIVSKSAIIQEGTFIGKNAVINAEAAIGKMCIINTGAVIEHECVIGDYVHVAVGAILCGHVVVKEAAFIGANTVVIQNKIIESKKIIPAGVTIR